MSHPSQMAMVANVLPPEVETQRRIVEVGGLRSFIKYAFHVIEPRSFIPNWHIDAVADHIEAVTRGDIRNLIVNVPPGTMKSILGSVMWAPWAWAEVDPSLKYIYASYSSRLSRKDATRCRDVINSEWYQARWGFETHPETGRPLEDKPLHPRGWGVCIPWQNTRAASMFRNNHGGFRFSTSTGGGVTGEHADILVMDDPNKSQAASGGKAATGVELQNAIDFWTETMSSRQANPKTTRKVIIMQRLHANDVCGAMLETGQYEHLCLPMEFDPQRKCKTSVQVRFGYEPPTVFEDPREEEGELLWEARYGEEELETLKTAMGPVVASAQLDQNPTPPGGAIFKADYLQKVWTVLPARIQLYQSWDCTFKDEQDSDWVVGQLWGRFMAEYFLIDQVRGKMDFWATVQAVKDFKAKWPKTTSIWIEDKANGTAVIKTLKKLIPGIKEVNPEGGKESRANAVVPFYAAGNVYLPSEQVAPWIGDWRQEHIQFPRGKHDDQVDAGTQALVQLTGGSGNRIKAAMDAMKRKAA